VRPGQLDRLPGQDMNGLSNWTNDCFVAFCWQGADGERLVAAVNYAPNQSQCRVRLPFEGLGGKSWLLQDQLSSDSYERDGNELQSRGLFVDLRPWQASVFALFGHGVDE
jgi:hypothetical protein